MDTYDPSVDQEPQTWLELDESDRLALIQIYHEDADLDAPSAHLHAAVHSIVETQLAAGEPAEVRTTLRRLLAEGLDRHDAIHAIGSLVAEQVHAMLGTGDQRADPNEAYRRKLLELTASRWRAM